MVDTVNHQINASVNLAGLERHVRHVSSDKAVSIGKQNSKFEAMVDSHSIFIS